MDHGAHLVEPRTAELGSIVNPTRWQQLKSAFDEALRLDPSQRPGYIDEVCALDPALRKEIESGHFFEYRATPADIAAWLVHKL
jgi:hypothetical protein